MVGTGPLASPASTRASDCARHGGGQPRVGALVAVLVATTFSLSVASSAGAQGRPAAPPPSRTGPPAAPSPRPQPAGEAAREASGGSEPVATSDGELSPHPRAATATTTANEDEAPQLVPKYATGFLMATTSTQVVPRTVERNRLDYGVLGYAGISAGGTPWETWDYLAYVIATVQASAVSGTGGGVAPEQITIRWSPTKTFSVQAGWMRMPFSFAQSSVITSSMFPTRPEPTGIFHGGADAGLMLSYETRSGVVRAKLGIFDGLSLGLTFPGYTARGPITAVSLEVSPLGPMRALEADFGNTPFLFAITASALYRDSNAYDQSGYKGLDVQDVRFAGSLRAGYKGFYVQGEYLQAVQSDDLSSRPRITRGAYGEGSYYAAVNKKIGLSPLVRLGWSEQDANFFPLHVVTLHGGMAFYPRGDIPDPSALRFVLQYRSERRVEERETAYGVLLSGMYRF